MLLVSGLASANQSSREYDQSTTFLATDKTNQTHLYYEHRYREQLVEFKKPSMLLLQPPAVVKLLIYINQPLTH